MRNEILLGDFRDIYPELEGQEFTVISDPPYNRNYHYDEYDDNLSREDYLMLLSAAFDVPRSVVIHYPDQMVNDVMVAMNRKVDGLVTWVYPSNTAKQSRLIAWFGLEPNMRGAGQPYKNPKDKRIAKLIAEGKQARLYDWWEINQVKNVSKTYRGENHPCPIPMELAERLVLVSTERGDLVVDPFCGQGTILAAAKKHGRDYIGIDVSTEYVMAAFRLLESTEVV